MPLTPYDVHNKDFNRTLRGYDIDEVDDLSYRINRDFETITCKKSELQQQNAIFLGGADDAANAL